MADDQKLQAFKEMAISQGYNPAEVESFMSMATAANTQQKIDDDKTRSQGLEDYEARLKLQQQYSSSESSILSDPSSSGQSFLKDVTDDQGSFIDIVNNNPSLSDEDIVELARANVNKYGPFKESNEQLRKMGLGVVVDAELGSETTKDPLKWAADSQAFKYLTGKTKDERIAQATSMQTLGLDGYLKASALPDLLSEKELKARDAATNVLNISSSIYQQIMGTGKEKDIQGIGPIGRFRPRWATDPEGVAVIQDLTELTAEKMRLLSGVAISEKEMKRLSNAFPKKEDTEQNVAIKSRNIADAVEIGLQMQELAKRNRLTLDEAYYQYGAEAFRAKGQPVPAWIESSPGIDLGGKDSGTPGLNLGSNKVGRFTIEVQ